MKDIDLIVEISLKIFRVRTLQNKEFPYFCDDKELQLFDIYDCIKCSRQDFENVSVYYGESNANFNDLVEMQAWLKSDKVEEFTLR